MIEWGQAGHWDGRVELYTGSMAEWDAARYHRISDPQLAWGRMVAARLRPAPGERILDVGCGTGRLTAEIAAPPARVVVGLDQSAAMLREARSRTETCRVAAGIESPAPHTPERSSPIYVRGDGTALPFGPVFDAVFSTATFHWVLEHDRLFASIHGALTPGGRLVAQCGGAGNLDRLYARSRALMADPRYTRFYSAWEDPWLFAGVDETRARLAAAGFVEVDVSLASAPTPFDSPESFAEFIGAVCLRHELARLPGGLRDAYVAELTGMFATDDPPLTLDYWRLNISARKRAS